MKVAGAVALPRLSWETEFLEDTSLRRIVIEHYDRENASLRRYFVFLGLRPDVAEEVVQESFLRLHQHLLGGGDRSNLRAWLYRVGHNLARSEQAAYRAKHTEPIENNGITLNVAAAGASPEQELLADEQMRQLKANMSQLADAQRQCLVLRAQGFKYREIAEVLNLSVSTVGEHVQKALERLRLSL